MVNVSEKEREDEYRRRHTERIFLKKIYAGLAVFFFVVFTIVVCWGMQSYFDIERSRVNVENERKRTEKCRETDEKEIRDLFDRWNKSLQSLKPEEVAANYADPSILLPTASDEARLSKDRKLDYFKKFLEHEPTGTIDLDPDTSMIEIGCNIAVDSGLYTFEYKKPKRRTVFARYSFVYKWNGEKWLITSHHSSIMPP